MEVNYTFCRQSQLLPQGGNVQHERAQLSCEWGSLMKMSRENVLMQIVGAGRRNTLPGVVVEAYTIVPFKRLFDWHIEVQGREGLNCQSVKQLIGCSK